MDLKGRAQNVHSLMLSAPSLEIPLIRFSFPFFFFFFGSGDVTTRWMYWGAGSKDWGNWRREMRSSEFQTQFLLYRVARKND